MRRYPYKLPLCLLFALTLGHACRAQDVMYKNNFDAAGPGPYANPYMAPPVYQDSGIYISGWTVTAGSWTSYAVNGGSSPSNASSTNNSPGPSSTSAAAPPAGDYALAAVGASGLTDTLDLLLGLDSVHSLTISGFNFDEGALPGGYRKWDLLVNGTDVATGDIYADKAGGGTGLQNENVVLGSPIENLIGAVRVDLVLSGGGNVTGATFRLNNFNIYGGSLLVPVHPFFPVKPVCCILFPINAGPATVAGGSTDGTFNVSALGGATYSVPIKVPTGFNGVQPNISLTYNSQGGNGIMGMGWTLGAVSAISRAGSTIYNDKNVSGVGLTAADKFALDGGRLILTGGTYGAPSSQYRTENESFKTITANGTLGNGPASFTVTDENGWAYYYGSSTNSIVQPSGIATPYMWLLDRVADLSGNYMTYEYTQLGNGEVNLLQIDYEINGNGGLQGLTAQARITFGYADRSDPQTAYVGGGKIQATQKLTTITCEQNDGSSYRTAHKYTLNYTDDVYTHLTSIMEAGKDNTEVLNPTAFTYGGAAPYQAYQHPELAQQQAPVLYKTFATGDFNGDGKTDLVQYSTQNGNNNFSLFLNQGAGNPFQLAQSGLLNSEANFGNSPNFLPRKLAVPFDYDGDGKDDFFYQQIQTYGNNVNVAPPAKPWIYLSTGTALTPLPEIVPAAGTTASLINSVPLVGDFDGDGKSEILEVGNTDGLGSATYASYLIGQKYNTPSGTALVPYVFGPGNPLPFTDNSNTQLFAIDYNGDGKTDVMQITGSTTNVYEMNVTFDANNNPVMGTPAFKLVNSTGYPSQWHTTYVGDFNGDHITDVLTYYPSVGWQIGYGNGSGWMNDQHPAPNPNMQQPIDGFGYNRPILIGDFNGDGKDDIYDNSPDPNYVSHIYYSQGYNSFSTEVSPVDGSIMSPSPETCWIGDFNGDGTETILSQGPVYYSTPNILVFHPNESRHLLSKITDGLGAVTKTDYQPLTSPSVYSNGGSTYTYPYVKRVIPLKVVSTTNLDNGVNPTGNNITYSYSGLKYNAWGKGLMGFDVVKSHDAAANMDNTQNFALNTTYAFPYLQSQSVSQTTGGPFFPATIQISNTANTYSVYNYGGNRIFTYPTQTTNTNSLTGESTLTAYSYTAPGQFIVLGAPPTSMDIGKPMGITTNKGNGLEVTTQSFTFPHTGTSGIPSTAYPVYTYCNPSSITTTTTRQGQAAYSRTTNFAYSPTNGLLTSTVTDPAASAVTTLSGYNSYGALAQTVTSSPGLPSIAKTITFDPSNRFVTKSYNISYPAVAGLSAFDPVSETTLTTVAADGEMTTNTYDAFARPSGSLANTGASASVAIGSASAYGSIAPPNAVYGVKTTPNTANASYKFYDRLGRPVRSAYPGHDGSLMIYEDVAYNTLGQVAVRTKPYFSNNAPQNITFSYDGYGRPTLQSAPEGTTTTTYPPVPVPGNYTVTVTDPAGQQKSTTTDLSGKAVSTTDNGGTLNYTYHSSGQPTQITLDGALVSQITFDACGRKLQQQDPNYGGTGSFAYTYNAYGQMLAESDPHGNQYAYTYDVLGNVTKKVGQDGEYDYYYQYTAGPGCGLMTNTASPGGASHFYLHNSVGQLESEGMGTNSQGFSYSYTYDTYGRLSSTYYPNGKQIAYSYVTSNGDVSVIQMPSNPRLLYLCSGKNALGQITSAVQGLGGGLPTAVSSTNTYNGYGLLTEQQSSRGSDNSLVRDYTYDFDPATGNLLQRKDKNRGLREDFSYDNLNRLTAAQNNTASVPGLNIYYLPTGNIKQKSDAGSFAYDQANRLSRIDAYVDVPETEQDVTYTPFNKVATITEGINSAAFTYWEDGSRSSMSLSQNGAPQKTKYYAPNFEREVDAATGAVRDLCYVTGPDGGPVAVIETKDGADKVYYVLTDHLGSITQLVDDQGNVTEKSYDAWGRSRDPQTWAVLPPTGASDGWDRGYTGHEHIPQFGVINMNGRLYDPLMGRVFSPDDNVQEPENSQSYNRYTYCLNNPLRYNDPSGEFFGIDDIIVSGIGFVAGFLEYGFSDHFVHIGRALAAGGISAAIAEGSYLTFGEAAVVAYGFNSATNYAAHYAQLRDAQGWSSVWLAGGYNLAAGIKAGFGSGAMTGALGSFASNLIGSELNTSIGDFLNGAYNVQTNTWGLGSNIKWGNMAKDAAVTAVTSIESKGAGQVLDKALPSGDFGKIGGLLMDIPKKFISGSASTITSNLLKNDLENKSTPWYDNIFTPAGYINMGHNAYTSGLGILSILLNPQKQN